MDVKLVSVIVGALLGGGISAASFYFKSRKEVKEKINEALFQLLEVWSLIAVIRVTGSDKFHSILIDRIKANFPHENIGENEEESIKDGMINALPLLIGMEENKFDNRFFDKYKASVNDLAKIYPLLAFRLNRNHTLIQFLGALDKLVLESPTNEGDMEVLQNVKEFMLSESLEELESDLITLASSSGYRNKREIKLQITHLQIRMESIPSDIFDSYIEKVIAPAVQSHYDKLGIPNPNIAKK